MHTSLYTPNRQFLFVQRQSLLFKNRWLIAAAAGFGLMLLVSLLTAYFRPAGISMLLQMYSFVFTLAGLLFTSQIFMELHTPNQAYSFLTLPASTLEKLLGSWLLTSPLYIAAYTLVTFTIYLLSCMLVDFAVSPLTYFAQDFWYTIGSYMVTQTIFLWGACYFRKNNFLKTILAILVFVTAVGLYGGLLGWLVLGGENSSLHIGPGSTNENEVETILQPISQLLYWGVLGPYMMVVAYFTLKERQL